MDFNSSEFEDPYVTWPIRNIILGTFIPIFPITIGGNCLVICVIIRNRSMRTVTNFFLANLAVADLMVAIFCIIPQMMWFVSPNWPFGAVMCKLHKYMLGVTTKASIFILMAISGERFVAIIYPLRIRRVLTIGRLSCILCFLWLISFLLSIPSIRFFDEAASNGTKQCGVSLHISKHDVFVHDVVNFILCYVLPLFVMMYFYARIIISLWLRGKAVYYRTSCHGRKNSHAPQSVEMEVRMHTGGGVQTHAHKPHENSTSESRLKVTGGHSNGRVDSPKQAQAMDVVEDINSQKIGPFFVDYPPPSPRRTRDPFSTSKSCENMYLLGGLNKSRLAHPALVRSKSRSTGTIDQQQQQDTINSPGSPAKNNPELEDHPHLRIEKNMNDDSDIQNHEYLNLKSDDCQQELINKTDDVGPNSSNADQTTSRPKPIRQRSTNFLPIKNGYENLCAIEIEDVSIESLLPPEKLDHSQQTSACEMLRQKTSLKKAEHQSVQSPNNRTDVHRPTVMVEMVPANNTRSSTKHGKKISKSTVATRKKVIRMLVVLVVAFAACLFPMQLLSLWTVVGTFPFFTQFGILFVPFTYLAYFFNSALNPLLYALLSDNFRSKMRETLDFRGSSRKARWMRTQTRLRSLTSEGTDNDWVV